MTPQERIIQAGLLLLDNYLSGSLIPPSSVREQIDALLRPMVQRRDQSIGEAVRPVIAALLEGYDGQG